MNIPIAQKNAGRNLLPQLIVTYKSQLLSVACMAAVFVIDIFTPPEFVVDILYLCSILIVFKKRSRTIIGFGFMACLLIVVNTWWFDHLKNTDLLLILNGSISILAIIITVYIALHYRTVRFKSLEKERQYLENLQKMLFITSHAVRRPVANILGLTALIGMDAKSKCQDDFEEECAHLATSAAELDIMVRDLNDFVSMIEQKEGAIFIDKP